MISRSNKFPLRTSFVAFRSKSKKISTPHTLVHYLPSMHIESPRATREMPPDAKQSGRHAHQSRLSVIVPKKVNKLATTRNALKRLSYDLFWSELKNSKLDVVVLFKPLPLTKAKTLKTQLTHEFSQIFKSL